VPVKKADSATITAAEEGTATNPTTEVEDVTTDAAAVTVTNPTTGVEAAMTDAAVAVVVTGTALSATTQTSHSARNATFVGNHAETPHQSRVTEVSTEGTTDVVASIEETTTGVVVSIAETTAEAVDATIHATAGTGIVPNATIITTRSGRNATAVENLVATRPEGPVTTVEVADVTADMTAGITTDAVALTAGTTTDMAVDASEAHTNRSQATGPATIVEPTISRAEPRATSAALTHATVAAEATDVDLDKTVDLVAEATDVDLDRTADSVAEATDVDLDRTADSVAEATGVDLGRTGTAEATDVDLGRTGTAEATDVGLGKIAVANVTVDKAGFDQRVRETPSESPEEKPMGTRTTAGQSPSVAHEAMTIEGAEHGGGSLPRRLGSLE
jgi:hypothetical protein